jgi:hypothetical protein
MGLSFTIAAGPCQRCHSQVRLRRDSWPYFTVSDSRLSQPGGPGPLIYIPHEQGGAVIPLGTGSLFVASYDSQDYGGSTRPHLHTVELQSPWNFWAQPKTLLNCVLGYSGTSCNSSARTPYKTQSRVRLRVYLFFTSAGRGTVDAENTASSIVA